MTAVIFFSRCLRSCQFSIPKLPTFATSKGAELEYAEGYVFGAKQWQSYLIRRVLQLTLVICQGMSQSLKDNTRARSFNFISRGPQRQNAMI